MKFFKVSVLLIFSWLAWSDKSIANTSATPESIIIQNVASDMRSFQEKKGHYPTNWMEFEQVFSLEKINEEYLKTTPVYPLQQHYVFVLQKIPMLGYQEGEVFLIRAEPSPNFLRDDKVGRYIISRYQGTLLFNWYSEEKVQQMLAKASIKELPEPEPWSPATNNAVHSQSPPTLYSTNPNVKSPREQKFPSTFQPPQNINSTNETVTVSPPPKEKSWWPVVIVLGIGATIFFAFTRTRKRP